MSLAENPDSATQSTKMKAAERQSNSPSDSTNSPSLSIYEPVRDGELAQVAAFKANALATIDTEATKKRRVIEKLQQLQANPRDPSLIDDDEVIEAVAQFYRAQHPGGFPQNRDGSFPLTPIELAVRKHRQATHALKSAIERSFADFDDLRSGAFEVRKQLEATEALLLRWISLSHQEKDSIPNRLFAIRQRPLAKRKEFSTRLQQIEKDWQGRKRADAIAALARVHEQVEKMESVSLTDRRCLLKTAKRLRRRDRRFLEKAERGLLSASIQLIRKEVDARWWEFWL